MTYLDINHLPPELPPGEQEKLMRSADDADRDRLTLSYSKMIKKFIQKYTAALKDVAGMSEEDVFMDVMYDAIKAGRRFNPDLGYSFSTPVLRAVYNHIMILFRRSRIHPYPNISLDKTCTADNGDTYVAEKNICSAYVRRYDPADAELQWCIAQMLDRKSQRDASIIRQLINGALQTQAAKNAGISQAQVSRVWKKFQNELKEELQQ